MIYKNFELYNVANLVPVDGGMLMARVPENVRMAMAEQGRRMATAACGCEIRFVINSGKAKLTLRTRDPGTSATAILYYGGVQAGWTTLYQKINDTDTVLEIAPPNEPEKLKLISDAAGYPYSTQVIRLLFDSPQIVIVDLEGDVRPPLAEETPAKRFMMYGSSITHGSLACAPNNTYLHQIARRLGCDMYSMGFAGACRMEPEMCDYLSEQDNEINPRRWDFAVMELGINILGIEPDDFEHRVMYLLTKMTTKNPDKKLFVIDIYYHSADLTNPEKSDLFREIVRRCAAKFPQARHIPGKSLLTSARGLSADFVHPNIDGVDEIARNLGAILEAEAL